MLFDLLTDLLILELQSGVHDVLEGVANVYNQKVYEDDENDELV